MCVCMNMSAVQHAHVYPGLCALMCVCAGAACHNATTNGNPAMDRNSQLVPRVIAVTASS
jgi:hypothetical protein